jgi:hypothetical protein
MTELIENGSTVEWNGKKGTVVAFIPRFEIPSNVYPGLNNEPQSRVKLGWGIHGKSGNDRYLVRVDRTHSVTGKPIAPWWYGPRKTEIEKGHWWANRVEPDQVEAATVVDPRIAAITFLAEHHET